MKPSMPVGGQGDQPAAEDVEQDLDDVEQVQDDRRAEAHLGPVPAIGRIFSARVPLTHSAKSTTGMSGLRNPMAPKTRTCSRSVATIR